MTDARRNGFRCDSDEYVVAVVRTDDTEHPVRMINQSAAGFAVASASLKLKPGKKVQLRTNRGWSDVEVVHSEKEDRQTVFGLRLLGDLPDPRDRIRTKLALFSPAQRSGSAVKAGPLLTLSALSIVAFWLYMAYTAYRFQQ